MRSACLLLCLLVGDVWAAEPAPTPTGADEAASRFLAVLAQAPQVRALIARQQALRHQEGSAGRLPDPQLSLGYARKRMSSEHWPMYDLALEQPLPRWGERDATRALAASATYLGEADLASEVAQLAADLATTLADLDDLNARVGEAEAEEHRLAALATVLDARLASGEAKVIDRLALDTRRERLRLRLDDLHRQLDDRGALIRGRLGLPPTTALPAFAAPLPEVIDPAHTPAALEAEARRQEALAGLLDARAMGNPETAIGVRAEREAADAGNEDTIGVTVSISLPIARGAIAANEDAAHARLRAAERVAEAARWRTASAVDTARRALAQAERSAQLADKLLTRADAESRAITAALASGGAEITALLDLYDRLAELRVQVIEARTSARQAQAALWLHVIPALPTATKESTP